MTKSDIPRDTRGRSVGGPRVNKSEHAVRPRTAAGLTTSAKPCFLMFCQNQTTCFAVLPMRPVFLFLCLLVGVSAIQLQRDVRGHHHHLHVSEQSSFTFTPPPP